MFKKKSDSKFRFQHQAFKRRLQQARGYKRPVRSKPLGAGEIFLSKIGLGSWFSRFSTLLVFILLIYTVFVPNIFFVKNININGAQSDNKQVLETLVNSYLSKKLPWPQKNLLLLSKPGLKDFLQINDQKILAVNGIYKRFPSTLVLNVTPRVDQFLIQTASSTYFSVSDDGLITSEVFLNASSTLPSSLTSIKMESSDGLVIGGKIFSQTEVNFFNQVQSQLPGIVKSPITYFGLSDTQTPDLMVYLKNGFKIMFSLNTDPTQALNRLRLLFSQFVDSDINRLYYVDMRFGDSGYVCNKGSPCVQNIVLPAASTTPVNSSN